MKVVLIKGSMLTLTLSAALVLTACGGGGSTSSNTQATNNTNTTSTNTAQSTAIVISKDSAQQITADSVQSGDSLSTYSDVSKGFVAGVQVETNIIAEDLSNNALTILYKANALPRDNVAVGITKPASAPCTNGGSLSVNLNYLAESVISKGDTLNISASNCIENGITINGALNFTFNSDITNPSSLTATGIWKASMTIGFSNFKIASSTRTTLADGDLSIAFDQNGSNSIFAQITNNQLTLQRGLTSDIAQGKPSQVLTLNQVNLSMTRSGGNYVRTDNYNAKGSSVKLGTFDYSVVNLLPLKGINGSLPSEGKLKIHSASKGTVIATVLDSNNVRLEIDANDDGITDSDGTSIVSWTQLRALL